MKIRPVGVELFHADRQTNGMTQDMTKLIVAVSNFANVPKKEIHIHSKRCKLECVCNTISSSYNDIKPHKRNI